MTNKHYTQVRILHTDVGKATVIYPSKNTSVGPQCITSTAVMALGTESSGDFLSEKVNLIPALFTKQGAK